MTALSVALHSKCRLEISLQFRRYVASKCTIVCKSVVCKSIDTLRPDPWDINFGMSGKQVVNREITQCKVFSYREIDCLGVVLQILEETLMLRVLCLALQGLIWRDPNSWPWL
jgi:hypothetical protein